MKPLVSTIIPAFNADATLAETLDSVAAQALGAAGEVIVVDDGSTDGTAALAEAHPLRPAVVRMANGGAASAINAGIAAATGEYLAFLDSDDLWTPEKTALQLAALRADPGLDFVLGLSEAFECPTHEPAEFGNLHYVAGPQPGFLISTMMVRRAAVQNRLGMLDTSLRTGYFIEWHRHAVETGARFEMVGTVVHRRRIRPNTLSRRGTAPGRPDGLTGDFLEIARRAVLQRRKPSV